MSTPSRSGRSRTRPSTSPTRPSTGVRGAVERRSATALVYLSARPTWLVPAVSLGLLLLGLFLPPAVGAPFLLLLALLVGWLAYLSWPATASGGRAVRLLVVAMLGYLLVSRLL